MDKKLLSYFITGAVIAMAALRLGASFEVVLLASLIGPAVLLLAVTILRQNPGIWGNHRSGTSRGSYGRSGPVVVLLHGGLGAPGMMQLARGLEETFHVLEPFQRGSGDVPLSVELHVADLDEFLATHCRDRRPALVGHSWGAMLALAYAAAHPDTASSLVLVGCGTFDPAARRRLEAVRHERIGQDLRRRVATLADEITDVGERLKSRHELTMHTESFDLIEPEARDEFDAVANRQSWDDMMRLQENGTYPAAFAAIQVPVLMLHGSFDPHPGPMIRDSLEPYIPQLEYREWERCGGRSVARTGGSPRVLPSPARVAPSAAQLSTLQSRRQSTTSKGAPGSGCDAGTEVGIRLVREAVG